MSFTQRRKGAKQTPIEPWPRLWAFAPLRKALFAFAAAGWGGSCFAEEPPPYAEPRDESTQYVVATLLENLDSPCGLALRPGAQAAGPFELYLSESGAGRIVRIASDKPQQPKPVITGFPTAAWAVDGDVRVGPLGLLFLSRDRLTVGTGGLDAGADVVQVYGLPSEGATLGYDQVDHAVGPVRQSELSKTGEGDFISLCTTQTSLFVTGRGDQRGWLLRAVLDANRLAGLEPFIATGDAGVPGLMAATINPKRNAPYLVVGLMGAPTDERDSRIAMYSPTSGAVALQLAAGLYDVAALAYSPSGDLYAADLSLANPTSGGVYRIEAAEVDGRQSCRAVKIAAAPRPTALLFTPDGALYVSALGAPTTQDSEPAGLLLKIVPGPQTPKL